MLSRSRKLTTVGLPLRDDLLIRSLVQVIGTKTVDTWVFHEGFEADVALCNPDSSLSGLAVRRAAQSSALICVSVVHDGGGPLPGTRVLHAPVKSTELIALLNDISLSATQAGHAGAAHPAPDNAADRGIANVLHELMLAKSTDLHAIECDGIPILLVPASRTLYATTPPAEAEMERWLSAREVHVRRLGEQAQHGAVTEAAYKRDLDALLWEAGLATAGGALLSGLPAQAKFHLKRWPDFGRRRHHAFHFRMAALLSRNACSAEELAAASNHPVNEARAFINACAMCDLLVADAPAERPRSAPAPRRRYSSILNSIRSALGLRL